MADVKIGWCTVPFPIDGTDAATRIAQLDEAVQVIRSAWADEPASFGGEHHRVDGIVCRPPADARRRS